MQGRESGRCLQARRVLEQQSASLDSFCGVLDYRLPVRHSIDTPVTPVRREPEPAIPAPELEAQISRALQEVTIPERVLSWLLEGVTRVLHAEEDRGRQVRETLEKTLGEVRRESETLLSLRLRDLITDDVFVARKADLRSRMGDFEARLSAPPKPPDEVVHLNRAIVAQSGRLGHPDQVDRCAWTGWVLLSDEVRRCKLTGVVISDN